MVIIEETMCMILICWYLCFANREESTATIRGRSETFLTPLWLFQPVMDCSKYKCVISNVHVCICVYMCVFLSQHCVLLLGLAPIYSLGQCMFWFLPALLCLSVFFCYPGYHSFRQVQLTRLLFLVLVFLSFREFVL